MEFKNYFTLWCHFEKDNWSLSGFRKCYQINNAQDFWELYNNWDKLNGIFYKQYFLMKNDITPRWEDENNRDGGCWSIKLNINEAPIIWEKLSMLLVVDELSSVKDDINGISICLKKGDKVVIKIWNKSKKQSTIENLNKILFEEYNPEIIYIANNPQK